VHRSHASHLERAAEAPAATARLIGVIDVGSNTARLELFRASMVGAVRAIDERKEIPRLGLHTASDGRLAPEAMARGVSALKRFGQVLEEFGPARVYAVATSAVRDAPNAPEFLAQVQKASGLSLRVLSGVEEARYAYLGVASAWELDNDLVCDLGGGSLQVVEVRRGRLQNSVSLPLGALRLTQRYLSHDPPKERELQELRDSVRETLRAALKAFGGSRYRVFGVGGSVRALARASIDLRDYPIARVHGYELREHDLEALEEILVDMPSAKRRAIPGMGSDRADVIVAGLLVFEELVRASGADGITVSGTGIREGVALEAIGAELPAPADELVRRSVAAAAEGLAFDLRHGEAVAEVAGQLFDVMRPLHGWSDSERRALTVAAWMHDVGIGVDLWRHARHSSYLVRNIPLWGLDQREVLLASMATYLHEGEDPPSSWRKEFLPILQSGDIDCARGLGAIVRSAELLQAARPRFAVVSGGKALSVELGDAAAAGLDPRALEKARRSLERAFALEVRNRDS
jgi:exopolyphosphatase/guanosine-5'-triphosphate,3'-diphosphate pyrophosphatase